jgi:hypothetical protein
LAAWLGQILDQRARQAWKACPEQFGFRQGVGCLEAVVVLIALIRSRISLRRRLYVLFIDLRTAFPSINRSILIHRMLECGLSVAVCRLTLAALDMTVGITCVGNLVGKCFKEVLGVREGSVEGPHQFSMYINGVKQRLETEHPRLCKLLDVTIALLLYADDAAIPADSAEDLQLAAHIFETFCNDNRLFISVPKTVLTVFHAANDDGVEYTDSNGVMVDGVLITIRIYDQHVKAAPAFKYLGVNLDRSLNAKVHFEARCSAYQRAIGSLKSGLRRIPSYSHAFLMFLWRCLVVPVAIYGTEVFAWRTDDAKPFTQYHANAWRSLLQVGGRAPSDALEPFLGTDSITSIWRASRLALFLRLINSPAGSLQQLALITLLGLNDTWLTDALEDLRLVCPCLSSSIRYGTDGPFLVLGGYWNDGGEWIGAQPFCTSIDHYGFSLQHGPSDRRHKNHIKRITELFKMYVRRQEKCALLQRITQKASANAYSKVQLLHASLLQPGPPLDLALDWAGSISSRSALVAFFVWRFVSGTLCSQLLCESVYTKLAESPQGSERP